MSETKAGNLAAIRDWGDHYFYDKSEVAEFFMKLNEGLTAYKLTIIGPADTDITINDNDQTNPQEYVIKTPSTGVYSALFFFNEGSTLTLSGDGVLATHALNTYVDTIMIVDTIIATPVMTSNTTPSGIVRSSSVYKDPSTGQSVRWEPWHAFTQVGDVDGWAALNYQKVGEWIEYEFDNPQIILKLQVINRNQNAPGVSSVKKFILKASNNGVDYINLGEYTLDNPNVKLASQTYNIPNTDAYKIYRIEVSEAISTPSYVTFGCINLYKPDI